MNYGALEVLATAPLCYTHLCATEIPLGQSYWGGQIPSFAAILNRWLCDRKDRPKSFSPKKDTNKSFWWRWFLSNIWIPPSQNSPNRACIHALVATTMYMYPSKFWWCCPRFQGEWNTKCRKYWLVAGEIWISCAERTRSATFVAVQLRAAQQL